MRLYHATTQGKAAEGDFWSNVTRLLGRCDRQGRPRFPARRSSQRGQASEALDGTRSAESLDGFRGKGLRAAVAFAV